MTNTFQLGSLKDADYAALAAQVNRGGVLLYPTETTYGLGCRATNEKAIARIFELKQRPTERPFLVLVRDRKMLHDYVSEIPKAYEPLMKNFWPGPLTLVFPAKMYRLPMHELAPGLSTLAIRVSSHPFCTKLFEHLDAPLVSTSANLSGAPTPPAVGEVASFIRSGVDTIVDGGALSGAPSTIVRLEGEKPVIARLGALGKEELGI